MTVLNTKKLKEILAARRLQYKQFAAALGVKDTTMYKYISGARQPSLDQLVAMTQLLGLSAVDELLQYEKNVFLKSD